MPVKDHLNSYRNINIEPPKYLKRYLIKKRFTDLERSIKMKEKEIAHLTDSIASLREKCNHPVTIDYGFTYGHKGVYKMCVDCETILPY
jgi:hypothetical protein